MNCHNMNVRPSKVSRNVRVAALVGRSAVMTAAIHIGENWARGTYEIPGCESTAVFGSSAMASPWDTRSNMLGMSATRKAVRYSTPDWARNLLTAL